MKQVIILTKLDLSRKNLGDDVSYNTESTTGDPHWNSRKNHGYSVFHMFFETVISFHTRGLADLK